MLHYHDDIFRPLQDQIKDAAFKYDQRQERKRKIKAFFNSPFVSFIEGILFGASVMFLSLYLGGYIVC